jgi:hypothetical protein
MITAVRRRALGIVLTPDIDLRLVERGVFARSKDSRPALKPSRRLFVSSCRASRRFAFLTGGKS